MKLRLASYKGVWVAHFAGVCSLDGCSQAPKDGFMASGEMSNPDPQARN